MNEAVDSETSQGTFRKMALCVKCEVENGLEDISFIGKNMGGQGEDYMNFT